MSNCRCILAAGQSGPNGVAWDLQGAWGYRSLAEVTAPGGSQVWGSVQAVPALHCEEPAALEECIVTHVGARTRGPCGQHCRQPRRVGYESPD